jgi:hypothetical protein
MLLGTVFHRKQCREGCTFLSGVHENTVETQLSKLRLTKTWVNRNACKALKFPELPAARHL